MSDFSLVHCAKDDVEVCTVCLEKNEDKGIFYKSVPGTKLCGRHGGNKQLESIRRKAANMYRLQTWQARVDEFASGDQVKSLRAEIGILRMVLEQIIVQCSSEHDILMHTPRISDLVAKIEKVTMSCDRLERNMGMMLDKTAAMKMATEIVDLISSVVSDADKIDEISNGIIDILKRIQ